jgi:hypothetical protein
VSWLTPGWKDPGSGVRGVELAELLLQLLQLVAQPGGDLELQFAGGGEHLLVHLRDQVGELVAFAFAPTFLDDSPGTGDLPRDCCRPDPPSSSVDSESSASR